MTLNIFNYIYLIGDIDISRLLLRAGCSLDSCDRWNHTPAYYDSKKILPQIVGDSLLDDTVFPFLLSFIFTFFTYVTLSFIFSSQMKLKLDKGNLLSTIFQMFLILQIALSLVTLMNSAALFLLEIMKGYAKEEFESFYLIYLLTLFSSSLSCSGASDVD